MARRLLAARCRLDVVPLRWLGLAMLVLGAILSRLPVVPGLPCPLRTVTGIPCPACGMTTSVKAAVGLDVPTALSANPFGLLAVAVAVALLVRPRLRFVDLPVVPVLLAGSASWLFQLHRFAVF